MSFWRKLFFKKKPANNSYCQMCEKTYYHPDNENSDKLIVIDGVTYSDAYCSPECEEAAKLKSEDSDDEPGIDFLEGSDDQRGQL
jgi:hypothetical protein